MGMKSGFKKDYRWDKEKKDYFQNKLFGLEFEKKNEYCDTDVQFVSLLCLD